MAKWVNSYRDLPLLLNQWANVVRWELRPRIFLRTTEFLWQEGHTAHATYEDARAYAQLILHDVYADFMIRVLAIPVVVGRKTAQERFAGAINTMACEAMTRDGKALQMGTSHELGQNFSRAFDIEFSGSDGRRSFAWTTSWGSSARMVGGLIMVHGDDHGLRVPPALAPTQVVVMAVKEEAVDASHRIADELRTVGIRVGVDDRADIQFGRRAVDWELKGVPLRLEVGPRDLALGTATIVKRVSGAEKAAISLNGLGEEIARLVVTEQDAMLAAARAERDVRITEVSSVDDAAEAAADGWAKISWSKLGVDGEAALARTGITVRCLQRADGTVPDSEDEPDLVAYVARSY
jgi:prolyl-tRNA synthetase